MNEQANNLLERILDTLEQYNGFSKWYFNLSDDDKLYMYDDLIKDIEVYIK